MDYHRLANDLTGILIYAICIIFFIGILMIAGHAFAGQNPKDANRQTNPADTADIQSHPLFYPVKLFTKYISPVDGDRCPMYPSCSKYCLEASQKHGLFMGWIMTCDRLMRCGRDEVARSPGVLVNGVRHTYDPVINNDFWW